MNKPILLLIFCCVLLSCNERPEPESVLSDYAIPDTLFWTDSVIAESKIKNDLSCSYEPQNPEYIMWNFFENRPEYVWRGELYDGRAVQFLVQHPDIMDVYKWLRKNRSYTVIQCVRLANTWWVKKVSKWKEKETK